MSAMGSHDARLERRPTRWLCDECDDEYGSYDAAARCENDDRQQPQGDTP